MGQINIELFEAFKSLEKICNEIYGDKNGVTRYISDMETTSPYDADRIPHWKTDLNHLKSVRYIRNNIAHDGSFSVDACTEEDVAFIKDFYNRIFNTEDPLALKHKLKQNTSVKNTIQREQIKPIVNNQVIQQSKESNTERTEYHVPKESMAKTVIFIIFVSVMIILLILFGLNIIK